MDNEDMEYIDVETISPEKNKEDQLSQSSVELNFDSSNSVDQPDPDLEYIDVETISPKKNKDDQPNSVDQPDPDLEYIDVETISPEKSKVNQPSKALKKLNFYQPYPDREPHIFTRPHTVIRPHPIRLVAISRPLIFYPPHSIFSRRRKSGTRPRVVALDTGRTVHQFTDSSMQVMMRLLGAGYFNLTGKAARRKFIAGVYLLPGMPYMTLTLPVPAYLSAFRNELVKLDKKNKRRNI